MQIERESWKIFLACALGAGIGSLVALEMSMAFWWVGFITGGLVGYLSYEWRAVAAALPGAYRAARGWRLPPFFWTYYGWAMLLVVSVLVDLFLLFSVLLGELVLLQEEYWIFLIMAVSMILGIKICPTEEEIESSIAELQEDCYILAPPLILFWHIPRGIVWVAQTVVTALPAIGRCLVAFVRFVPRFCYELFIRVHSERRLLCGVDAMLGAAIGFLAGSVLIGAAAGGMLGLLNYELVSRRLLKLQIR